MLHNTSKKVVLAIGGNSLIKNSKKTPSYEEQLETVRLTCRNIAQLVKLGYKVAITHGNGPQVGDVLIRSYYTRKHLPEISLEFANAITQGLIGYMIQLALKNELKRLNINKDVVTVITQVVVSKNDPAFNNFTKPIGPFYSQKEARILEKEFGWIMKEDAGRGFRRLVSSPTPKEIVEINEIRTLLDNDTIVITCGGGGIPVINENNELKPVPAVIDKDLTSALLATLIDADLLIISTGVKNVYLNFNKPNQKPLYNLKLSQLLKYQKDNHFPEGSMGPKIQAIINFLKNNSKPKTAIITNPENILKSLKYKNIGTKVTL
ncbi:MAG: carbamate kinase [candidate division WOR-3 bacterium]|nr:carbamate kinase [candidate division WOR-3 bacterium]MCX7757935.1 carbamate kinase [candidate division WOR-3 bacterium]MDW7987697.1 carbamate kinase [candidate division WOR-3 bacterium]